MGKTEVVLNEDVLWYRHEDDEFNDFDECHGLRSDESCPVKVCLWIHEQASVIGVHCP